VVLVALVDKLMGTGDELQAIYMIELSICKQEVGWSQREDDIPLMKPCHQTANQRLGVTRPTYQRLRGHSRQDRKRHLRGGFPGLAQRRGSDPAS
jgi:hypothetical protein